MNNFNDDDVYDDGLDNDESNGTGHTTNRQPPGRWVSLGGKLRWMPHHTLDAIAEEDEGDDQPEADLPPSDDDVWESDLPPIPPGATEAVRVRAAMTWLQRQGARAQERLGLLALRAHDELRQREADAPHRRKGPEPPSATDLDVAEVEGVAAWFEDAANLLQESADRTPGRALVEWYLALQAEADLADDRRDPLAQARATGRTAARERALRYAERLALPEADDEE